MVIDFHMGNPSSFSERGLAGTSLHPRRLQESMGHFSFPTFPLHRACEKSFFPKHAFARYAIGNTCGASYFSEIRAFYRLGLYDSIASDRTKLGSPVSEKLGAFADN